MNEKVRMKMTLEELENAMDDESKQIGVTIAKLYRTAVTAMLTIPNMSLETEDISMYVNKEGITFHVGYPCRRRKYDDHEDYDDRVSSDEHESDEEEMIYDEL